MDWRVKSAAFSILEKMPHGKDIYDFLQRNVTKSLKPDDNSLMMNFKRKVIFSIKMLEKYGKTNCTDAIFYEFGAGWNLLTPLGVCFLCNPKEYICVDLNEFMKASDVKETVRFIERNIETINDELEEVNLSHHKLLGDLSDEKIFQSDDRTIKKVLHRRFNIDYEAPYDARNTGIEKGKIDYIISHVTLQHIPVHDCKKILKECYRILKEGGIMLSLNIYIDHYAYYDKKIGVYNFLKYSENEWAKYNHPHHYQNRMRHVEYEKIFREAGFEILDEKLEQITQSHIDQYNSITVHDEFNKYSDKELLTPGCFFVLRKLKEGNK